MERAIKLRLPDSAKEELSALAKRTGSGSPDHPREGNEDREDNCGDSKEDDGEVGRSHSVSRPSLQDNRRALGSFKDHALCHREQVIWILHYPCTVRAGSKV
jgi:hypothetical protein